MSDGMEQDNTEVILVSCEKELFLVIQLVIRMVGSLVDLICGLLLPRVNNSRGIVFSI